MIKSYQIKPMDSTYKKQVVIAYAEKELFWEDPYDLMNSFYKYRGFLMRSTFIKENSYH